MNVTGNTPQFIVKLEQQNQNVFMVSFKKNIADMHMKCTFMFCR